MECKLCNESNELELSHIIPKFVYKWIKRTSTTGGIRNSDNPNIRAQDGDKIDFLCGKCEDLFSVYEDGFRKKGFQKLQETN
ncbi:MAG: hypothetical protein N4A76_01385 [Firmicutes bacterium]|nr:hypothetical protein [Bacillota bacterium]